MCIRDRLKKVYAETIAPALMKQFNYSSSMQIPVLKKIVINQGLGDATQDKKMCIRDSNKKVKALTRKSALSYKAQESAIVVVGASIVKSSTTTTVSYTHLCRSDGLGIDFL